jgi:hypothetical protein
MPTAPYQEHVLAAPDVCCNCFRKVREIRIDPVRRFGVTEDWEETYQRSEKETEIGYAPADSMSEQKGVFCQCGAEYHRHRIWDADSVSRERFREFVKSLLLTLDLKGISLRRKEAAAYALQAFDDGAHVDQALAEAVEAGIVAEAASPETDTSP